ncbi:hypothetical protein BKG91_03765 [Rodentibacter caecimuris]|uniref:Uncharacterized protein n=1 Tax=Rodentibacter caecimuris TaxID=1796644 RepID=A0AAJ3MYS6_9PAST|nr:hypothetical protein [Rodentibacter heylii]OOF70586.1 hypothetical protein BKG90_09865 [Rodentibacter heylii]OOF75243.1 hypothetical protein BKG91_03765 [Rodentibacter heylii]OOF77201.1 hypothetical protein BKG99_04045 [Rodentibacter heylii]
MKIKSLHILDFFRELFIFSVVLAIFLFGNSAAEETLLWFFCLISFLAFMAAGVNSSNPKTRFTQNKTRFEFCTLLALCLIVVYFEHWVIATLVFVSNFVFIASCINQDKKDN